MPVLVPEPMGVWGGLLVLVPEPMGVWGELLVLVAESVDDGR